MLTHSLVVCAFKISGDIIATSNSGILFSKNPASTVICNDFILSFSLLILGK